MPTILACQLLATTNVHYFLYLSGKYFLLWLCGSFVLQFPQNRKTKCRLYKHAIELSICFCCNLSSSIFYTVNTQKETSDTIKYTNICTNARLILIICCYTLLIPPNTGHCLLTDVDDCPELTHDFLRLGFLK